MFKILFVLCFEILSIPAYSKIFRNAYLSFEMPEAWKCQLEHTEWVCRSEIDKESKESIIILTAKEVGPTDSFESYMSHLSKPQNNVTKPTNTTSKVIYAPKKILVNDHTWVDGLQLSSEVPNYFTRYLATIKDKVAVLVTFSAHKDHYTKYSQDFFKAVQSLRVVAAKNLLAKPEMNLRPGQETLGTTINTAMPGNMEGTEPMPGLADQKEGGSKTKVLLITLAAVILAGAGFVFLKSRG